MVPESVQHHSMSSTITNIHSTGLITHKHYNYYTVLVTDIHLIFPNLKQI